MKNSMRLSLRLLAGFAFVISFLALSISQTNAKTHEEQNTQPKERDVVYKEGLSGKKLNCPITDPRC